MLPIGDVLKRLRMEKKLSLRKLGNQVGINFNTLSAYERNQIQPAIENCQKLSRFFEVPVEYFIFGEHARKDFRDADLLDLFNTVDALEKEDREIIKTYIKRYLQVKKELSDLQKESKSPILKGRKKEE